MTYEQALEIFNSNDPVTSENACESFEAYQIVTGNPDYIAEQEVALQSEINELLTQLN